MGDVKEGVKGKGVCGVQVAGEECVREKNSNLLPTEVNARRNS